MRGVAGKTRAPANVKRAESPADTPKEADKMAGRESAQRFLTTRLNVPEAEAALKWYMKRHEDLKSMCRPCNLFKVPSASPTALPILN
jgi:hypothetical protein